jgi:hypothetical protein
LKYGARLFYAVAATLGAVTACGASGGDDDSIAGSDDNHGNGFGGTTNIPSGGGSGNQQPEPEQELDRAFRVPVVSGHWVWTANAKSGRVALIDATNFTVKTALAGAGPTYLAALPAEAGASRAIVINSVSQDATLFDASATGEITTSTTLPIHSGANAWAVTADGRFAIAWTDSSLLTKPDPSEGFQDITVLDLGGKEPTSKRLSVGYRPARIFLGNDDRYAYVVTDTGIDVVDLKSDDGAIVEREVELSVDPANDTARRDVNLTPDGAWAFVSRENKDYVTVVDVAHGLFKDITLPGIITDLDLSADASMAVAVIREKVLPADTSAAGAGTGGQAGESQTGSEGGGAESGIAGGGGVGLDSPVAGGPSGAGAGNVAQGGTSAGPQPEQGSLAVLLPVASIFAAPDVFDSVRIDDVFGSVDLGAQAQTALLFSNGLPSTHLTLLSLAQGDAFKHRTLDLKLPVFSAISTPDGAHAIAVLRPQAGSKQPGAFAVVPVAKNLPPKIQGTQAATVPADLSQLAPAMVAIDDTRALVTVSDGATVSFSYLVSMPELTVDPIALDSVPLPQASGIVREANQAFIAQQHPEGRITFIDLDTHELHTLTGFELSTQVGK